MLGIFKKHWPIVLLTTIAIVLCLANYTPGTWFSSWDALHPEFNFSLNFLRMIDGVFRSEQGLGAVAGHSHMSDLPRVILLYLLHFLFPLSLVRYLYLFATIIVGPVGMYLFLRRIVFRHTSRVSVIASFLGGLFYLLNLGTMQQYIVGFEMFCVLYAALPFLMLYATEYLVTPSEKALTVLVLFCLATLLATPMAYAATLWYMYFLFLLLYLGTLSIWQASRKNLVPISRSVVLIMCTLIINAFWLLPNLYFIHNHSQEVEQAYSNELFSPQAFLYNKEYGTLPDLAFMKSFLFDWSVYTGNNTFDELLKPWISHLQNPFVISIGVVIAGIALIGLIYAIARQHIAALALIPILFLTLFFLLTTNGPTGPLFTWFRDHIPLFQEALRFPQDKFYIQYIFIYAICFALGNAFLIQVLAKFRIPNSSFHFFLPNFRFPRTTVPVVSSLRPPLYALCLTLLLIYFMWPAFQGQFISQYLRIQIPQDYFSMFTWFNAQTDSGRVANLPIYSFWGWEYYDWFSDKQPSFQGAGFLWFGMKQPVLVRDFDRWSQYNEAYYREMSQAIYSNDQSKVNAVIKKYDIHYVLLDTSVIAPQYESSVLFYPQTKQLLQTDPLLEKPKQFGSHLLVYHVKSPGTAAVTLVSNASVIAPKSPQLYADASYTTFGDYISNTTDNALPFTAAYPFRSSITNEGLLNPNTYQLSPTGLIFHLPSSTSIQSVQDAEPLIPATITVSRIDQNLHITVHLVNEVAAAPPQHPVSSDLRLPTTTTPLILSINQKQVFQLPPTLDSKELTLGQIFLSTKSPNHIALYSSQPDTTKQPNFSQLSYALRSCDTVRDGQIFSLGIDPNRSGITLRASNMPLCLTVKLKDLFSLPDSATSEVLFSATSTANLLQPAGNANLCIADLTTGACMSSNASTLTTHAGAFPEPQTAYFTIAKNQFTSDGLRLFFDATKSDQEIGVHYANMSFGMSKPLGETDLSLPPPQTTLSVGKSSQIIIPFASEFPRQNVTELPRTSGPCGNSLFNQPVTQKTTSAKTQGTYIRYISASGSLCDHFSYQNLTPGQAYVLLLTSRNISGLPLQVCVTNQSTKRCDVYTRLPQTSTFQTAAIVIPALANPKRGYDININNFGISGTPAVNDLQSLQLLPFPEQWLTSLHTVLSPNAQPSQTALLPYDQEAPYRYSATITTPPVSSTITGSTVLVLHEGYEDGWTAYKIQHSTSKIKNTLTHTLPFFFGTPLSEHVLVDTWANGWVLPADPQLVTNTSYIIIFWPQYLEFAGFLLLGTLSGWLIWRIIYRQKHPQDTL